MREQKTSIFLVLLVLPVICFVVFKIFCLLLIFGSQLLGNFWAKK